MRLMMGVFLVMIVACAVPAPGAAQQLGRQISLGAVSEGGIFDPSLADTAPGREAWMSYSAVDPSSRWPRQNKRSVTTRLAYSNDAGATWTDVGYRINNSKDVTIASKAGTWNSEVPSLVFDPSAPEEERWRLFWHHYLQVNGDGQFQNGWIGYKNAATPQGLRSAREIKLFGGKAYNTANDEESSDTGSPLGGRPVIKIEKLSPDLNMCVALSEPGAMATPSGLYLSLVCYRPKIANPIGLLGIGMFGVTSNVILLKCDAPCHAASSGAWKYVATVMTADDAKSAGFESYSASDLFGQNNRAYLIVSPVTNGPFPNSYNGCRVFRFANLATGELERNHGNLQPITEIHGVPGSFNGACTYQPAVTASGFMYSQLKIVNSAPHFQIYQTGITLPGATSIRKMEGSLADLMAVALRRTRSRFTY